MSSFKTVIDVSASDIVVKSDKFSPKSIRSVDTTKFKIKIRGGSADGMVKKIRLRNVADSQRSSLSALPSSNYMDVKENNYFS